MRTPALLAALLCIVTGCANAPEAALAELRAGRKQTHWMWFIFPQLTALGRSPTAKHFGLDGLKTSLDCLDAIDLVAAANQVFQRLDHGQTGTDVRFVKKSLVEFLKIST